jgi:hypothetical protein
MRATNKSGAGERKSRENKKTKRRDTGTVDARQQRVNSGSCVLESKVPKRNGSVKLGIPKGMAFGAGLGWRKAQRKRKSPRPFAGSRAVSRGWVF